MVQQSYRPRPRAEKVVVFVYLFLACLTLAHAVYLGYSTSYVDIHAAHPGLTLSQYYHLHNSTALSADHPLFSGTDHAPNQYRIAIPYTAKWIASIFSTPKYYFVYAVLDFACAFLVCAIFYFALCRSRFFQSLDDRSKTIAVGFFLASLAYPFAWIVPWERPETLPTALYLAVVFMLLERVRSKPQWLIAVFAATLWQGFVRSDIPSALGIAIAIFSFTPQAKEMFGSRRLCIFSAFSIFAIAAAVQAYLKLSLFPHATYPPDTVVIEFFLNLKPRTLIVFVIAILPYLVVLFGAANFWKRLDPIDILIVLASCVYLPLWWTLGIAMEVRIFAPYLLAITPTAAKTVLLWLEPERAAFPESC